MVGDSEMKKVVLDKPENVVNIDDLNFSRIYIIIRGEREIFRAYGNFQVTRFYSILGFASIFEDCSLRESIIQAINNGDEVKEVTKEELIDLIIEMKDRL